LPRLGYVRALSLVGLWGVLFVLVLTMISGARELLTPGAWEKQVRTYRLSELASPTYDESPDLRRFEKLQRLQVALWEYALSHDGQFPSDRSASGVSAERWESPDVSCMRYVYVPGQRAGRGNVPLAYEPEVFGPQRLVLMTNGEIRRKPFTEILRALPGEDH